MPGSLGIYVEDNLIKYAKVVKDNNKFKVEAYGIKFYENLAETLNQIVKETYSFKIPISINITNELYNYFDMFSLLNKQDVKKAVDIEFEMLCNEKGYDKESLEAKYLITQNLEDSDKVKVLYVAANKSDITKKTENLSEYKIGSMTPISTSIANIVDKEEKNVVIINIEDETKITTILNGEIYRVDVLKDGMRQILNDINRKENSWIKTYEICKNTTLYTQDGTGLQTEDNEYLDDIMPVLYRIVQGSKKIIDNIVPDIDKVYITGTATAINNIDLYFQDYLSNMKCEMLKPYFIESASLKTSIKDYIEVNSAIALAMENLGVGTPSLNFKSKKANLNPTINFRFSKDELLSSFDSGERLILRITGTFVLAIVLYTGFSKAILTQINAKQAEANNLSKDMNSQISLMESDIIKMESHAAMYTKLKEQLTESTNVGTKKYLTKDAIPNFLNKIMFDIPQRVQITSIENTSGTHIVIQAQSDKYEQLGYFNAVITNKEILKDVKSTSGIRQDSMIKITIEGELP